MKPFFGANWKMNGSWPMGLSWLQTAKSLAVADDPAQIVVFPPFTLLPALSEDAREAGIGLGAQDVFYETAGAFTGEISPSMLVEAGCSWVLAGHSERRHILGESDQVVRRKLEAALGGGLSVVLCLGELLEQRDAGGQESVVRDQLSAALAGGLPDDPGRIVIAYEPVWAIGTGRIATPEQVSGMHLHIRKALGGMFGEASSPVRIIYGGSVKPGNSAEILAAPGVDGALVGGASLDAEGFLSIARSARA